MADKEYFDFDELRKDILERFKYWYSNEKTRKKYEDTEFTKPLNTTLTNYEDMAESFETLLKIKKMGSSTLRKLFFYKEISFSKTTLGYFTRYAELGIPSQQLDHQQLEVMLTAEYEKWKDTSHRKFIEQQYFMPKEKFNDLIDFCFLNRNRINPGMLIFNYINAVYFGDLSIHYYLDFFENNRKLIQILFQLLMSNWIRVSWRSAYVLSQLNHQMVTEMADIIQQRTDQFDVIISAIKNNEVIQYLENIISTLPSDVNSALYANQVLRLIRNRTSYVDLNELDEI